MTARWQKVWPFLRAALALVLSLGTLFLALRGVSWDELRLAFTQADWRWVGLAFGSVTVNTLVKALRWQWLCGQPGRANSFWRYLGLLLAGQALNWLYPARLGDLLRAQAVGESGPGITFALGTLVTEKTFDTLAYALLLILVWAAMPLPQWLELPVMGMAALALFLAGGVALLALAGQRMLPLGERVIGYLPLRLRQWVSDRVRRVLSSLDILQSRRAWFALSALTALAWLTAILNNWLVFRAIHLDLPLPAALLLLAALQAGITLPAIPGGIGIFEYTCVLVLGVWGVAEAAAFGCGVLLHALVMLPALLLGLISLGHWGLSPRRSV